MDPIKNNHIVRAKVVTIKNTGPARWEVEFEGVVTRRDIHRINRVLKIEFARAQRRYSLKRKKAAFDMRAAVEMRAAEMSTKVEILPKVVVQSDDTSVLTKTKEMTSTKVKTETKTKETVQNA